MVNEAEKIIKSVSKLKWDYITFHNLSPRCVFISKSMMDKLKKDSVIALSFGFNNGFNEKEPTLFGMKVYEVVQDNVIKITD